MTQSVSDLRSHHTPIPIIRGGCAAKLAPFYQVVSKTPEERKELINEYVTMRLVHYKKNGTVKNSYCLRAVHEQLENASLSLSKSGSSNILLSKISFDCLIQTQGGEEHRKFVTFDLKMDSLTELVFSYDTILKTYGSKDNLYKTLEHFYTAGRQVANPTNEQHGHEPNYDQEAVGHDQFIRHTEQLLVAYLALPETAKMLATRLKGTIRGANAEAKSVKVYNMGLHMHSTKTCCAPCEYVLLGLMNQHNEFTQGDKSLGFLHNFRQAAITRDETLPIKLPQNSFFRLLVTVSASEADGTHKKIPAYSSEALVDKACPYYNIDVKSEDASGHIFTALINQKFDQRRAFSTFDLSDITVAISGSLATRGTEGTIQKVRQVKRNQQELGRRFTIP